MLKLIALLERPTRGTVIVNGKNTNTHQGRGTSPRSAATSAWCSRITSCSPTGPVFDNVALPLVVSDTPLREIDKRVRAALDQVGLLGKERVSAAGAVRGRAAARGHRARGGEQAAAADRG